MRHALLPLALLLAACGDNLTPAPQNTDSSDAPREVNPGPGREPYQPPPPEALACVPNLDGQIDRREVHVALGAALSYLVPPAGSVRTMDLAGGGESPRKQWAWATDFADEQYASIGPSALSGKWYAHAFPGGQFAVPVDLAGTTVAINSLDEKGMYLHGLASTEPGPEGDCDALNPNAGPTGDCTLYVYDPPIKALAFPLKPGGEWSSTGVVRNGTFRGLPYASKDTYLTRVDAVGAIQLPDLTFQQAHRVRTDVKVETLGLTVTQKQVSFYAECFGEIARATSGPYETADDFEAALEVRRLGLGLAEREPYLPPPPVALPCAPNRDGQLDGSELKVALGASVPYLVPPAGVQRTVDLVGNLGAFGGRTWFWDAPLADDQLARIGPSSLSGKWFAARFPANTFAVPVDLAGTTFAINSIDESGMYIHGLASKDPGAQNDCSTAKPPTNGCTLYTYDTPVKALSFPLKPGVEWTSVGVVRNGTFNGIPYASEDTYRVRVDATGAMRLPDLSFAQAHKVHTDVTVKVMGVSTTVKQVSFYSECFGEVARATSNPGETQDDFSTAREVRRLGLP